MGVVNVNILKEIKTEFCPSYLKRSRDISGLPGGFSDIAAQRSHLKLTDTFAGQVTFGNAACPYPLKSVKSRQTTTPATR